MDIIISIAKITALMASFAAVDRVLLALRFQRPYYAVHVIHNIAVSFLTAPDLVASVTRFHEIQSLPLNWNAINMVYALHFYHTALYWRTFRFDDWLHHILMIGVALPLGCLVPAGPLMGFSLFFTTGLPGGIGYAALWLERNGWLSRLREKQVSQVMNVWIRAPGCVAQAALTLAMTLSSPMSPLLWWVGIVEAILNAWNGLYFMEQVVVAATLTKTSEAARVGANNRGLEDDRARAMNHGQ
jgi:hypothetical protein